MTSPFHANRMPDASIYFFSHLLCILLADQCTYCILKSKLDQIRCNSVDYYSSPLNEHQSSVPRPVKLCSDQ